VKRFTVSTLREDIVGGKEGKGSAGVNGGGGAEPSFDWSSRLTQRHSLQFAKQESLDLVHWIILSHHRCVHLRP